MYYLLLADVIITLEIKNKAFRPEPSLYNWN